MVPWWFGGSFGECGHADKEQGCVWGCGEAILQEVELAGWTWYVGCVAHSFLLGIEGLKGCVWGRVVLFERSASEVLGLRPPPALLPKIAMQRLRMGKKMGRR